jgi:hypothetical protein
LKDIENELDSKEDEIMSKNNQIELKDIENELDLKEV